VNRQAICYSIRHGIGTQGGGEGLRLCTLRRNRPSKIGYGIGSKTAFDQMHLQQCQDRISILTALGDRFRLVFTGAADGHVSTEDSFPDAMYQRLRQIEVERVKVLNEVHNLLRSQDLDTLHTVIGRLAALERYSQHSHSKLKNHLKRAAR
jgi:hypothetical protein